MLPDGRGKHSILAFFSRHCHFWSITNPATPPKSPLFLAGISSIFRRISNPRQQ
jgi:hypothetical protein